MTAQILLADADAFFVAVARRVDPEGAGRAKLLIVGGRPGSRGVVCSASYETREFGVRSAMPISRALRLCPDAMCVPVPRYACSDASRAIRAVLGQFTPAVEGASIDEWYLDLTGTEALYRHAPLAETAKTIRRAVLDQTGYALSIGGGTNRMIAKLAAERAKPSRAPEAGGVHIVPAGGERKFMATLSLAEIPGVGPKAQARLSGVGLINVADVLGHDIATLTRWLDRSTAEWLHAKARGEARGAVEPRAPARQMSREETFDRDLVKQDVLEAELRHLARKVAADMREEGLAARTITVKLKCNDFVSRTASRTLPDAVESDRAVVDTAVSLLAKLRMVQKKPARLVGVALSNFNAGRDAEQLAMAFAPPSPSVAAPRGTAMHATAVAPLVEEPRDRDLSRAIDRVRERFGDDAIRAGRPRARPVGEKGARKPRE
ncbi:MAG: DNA polymerase IV [Gemmatimonadetes bacterium]|nr:DNA polymerase IV [Gemmatimonadota bacterium]